MMKRWIALVMALVMMLALAACGNGEGSAVPVVSVGMLTGAGTAAEKYAGEVISEQVTEINRDSGMEIKELCVAVGDEVQAGQVLFRYDSDALSLALDKAKLELEQKNAVIAKYTQQIAEIETQIKTAKDSEKTALNIQLQTLEVDRMEAQYDVKARQKEIDQMQITLQNAKVVAPVGGRIRSIDEDGFDDYGNPVAYITIQQSGAYRVKAQINELNLLSGNSGVQVGAAVRVVSRVDSTKTWSGTIASIDTEDPGSQSSGGYFYDFGYGVDTGSGATGYTCYVVLEDTTGLVLGQHVFVEILTGVQREGIWMPAGYLMDLEYAHDTASGTAQVWAAGADGKLERRTVTLGAYDEGTDTYEILGGLTAEDYVADPGNGKCAEGAVVEYRSAADFEATAPAGDGESSYGDTPIGGGEAAPDGMPDAESEIIEPDSGIDVVIEGSEGEDTGDIDKQPIDADPGTASDGSLVTYGG